METPRLSERGAGMPPARDRNGNGKESSADRKKAHESAGGTTGDQEGPPSGKEPKLREPVVAALRAVAQTPENLEGWDRLEAVAIENESQAAAADAYRKVLRLPNAPALLMELGQRAVRFHQEWMADRPAALSDILQRVLEIDPSADWALKQLIVVLTLEESWDT